MNTELSFHDHKITVTLHNNQIYLTVTQIGLALNYANPETAVTKIFNRHKDEFTEQMSTVVSLTTQSGSQNSRIFSLRGAHLIAMFARTPVAKEFRRWVLDILDREVGEPTIQPTQPTLPIPDDYANRIEMIYYQDFKAVHCRVLHSNEIVMSHEAMKRWLELQGLIFFTREELENLTLGQLAEITSDKKAREIP